MDTTISAQEVERGRAETHQGREAEAHRDRDAGETPERQDAEAGGIASGEESEASPGDPYRGSDLFPSGEPISELRRRLGTARFDVQEKYSITIDPSVVWERYASKEAWAAFQENGTVNIPGIFDFLLEDPEIREYIDLEFEMYRYHLDTSEASVPNVGWLRHMWYSILQQAIRQNIVYYALVASARPDKNYWLLSFPHYAKDTTDGEKTGSHPLDLNVRQYVESDEVQLIESTIPHGPTGIAYNNRRVTMFPCFTGIRQPEHIFLDNEESTKFNEIFICNMCRDKCPKLPSGRMSRSSGAYSQGTFSVTVPLPSSSKIGDALVGQRLWDSLPVMRQCAIIFGSDDKAAREEVEKVQKATIVAYKKAFQNLKKEEQCVFGDVSFFRWWYNGGREGTAPRPPPDGPPRARRPRYFDD